MKKYKLYLFDFDRTLMNTINYLKPFYKFCYGKVGFNITDEDCDRFILQSVVKTFEELKLNKEQIAIVTKAWVDNCLDPKYFSGAYVYDDARELVNKLINNNVAIGIVTGNDKNVVKDMLLYHNVDANKFVDILGMHEFKEQKPSAEPILEFIRRHPEYKKEDIVYIGDAIQDKLCAINAGVDYIIVSRDNVRVDEKDIFDLREIY